MSVLQFALLGLGLGGAYALLALGLVTIYRGTGVLNFAQGAVAMICAYVFFALRDDLGWHTVPAVLLTLAFSVLLGVAFYLLVMRQLRNSPMLARIIATLALLLLLQGLAILLFDVQTKTPAPVVPAAPVTVLGVPIPADRLVLAAVAVVLAVALALISRRTRIGLAIRAISDSEKGASLSGLSPVLIGALTWAMGFALAAVAGVMLSPVAGLDSQVLTLLVVPVFAAALIARFTSFGVAVAAGLGLGMVESALQLVTGAEGAWYTWLWTGPGRSQAIPALVVILAMIFSGRLLPARGEVVRGRLPVSLPPRYRVIGPLLALAVGLVFIHTVSSSWLAAGVVTLAGVLIALSVVVVTGLVGQVSLAQVAFAGIGGMMTALFANAGLPFPLVLLLSGAVATLVGLLVGLPSLRVRGPSLALVTLSAAYICQVAVFSDGRLLGGDGGYNRVPAASLFGRELSSTAFAVVALVIVVATASLVAALRASTFGRRALAVRENEAAAAAAGINLKQFKLAAFALSAFIAGLGGSLLSYQANVFAYERFTVFESLHVIAMAAIGGIGMVSGAIFAGLGASGGLFSQLLATWEADAYQLIIAGGALLIAIQVHPDGLASTAHAIRTHRRRRATPAPAPTSPDDTDRSTSTDQPVPAK
ncbi:ABC transporter permease [Thermobifida halotolerans]|uniref:ABC transporter permease n=1 Tax=Thermobifida halotolerans TaxID=483545 RepID=A0AA97M5A2_9ACTN|nr:ABC transporter permease [Thermobifida halotolerans]UOE21239.1 ABC transporter permease [Thermobifida halotolerans]